MNIDNTTEREPAFARELMQSEANMPNRRGELRKDSEPSTKEAYRRENHVFPEDKATHNNWDKIAKTGTWTDMHGKTVTLTKEFFKDVADNYKNLSEKAPAVFGHPQINHPAQAWVAELRLNGEHLEARYEDIKPEARKSVETGEYRYKSPKFDLNSRNLIHVGWLGAVPPAMTGLGEIQFAYAGGHVSVCFDEREDSCVCFSKDKGENNMDKELAELLAGLKAELAQKQTELDALKRQLAELTAAKDAAEKKTEDTEAEFAKYRADFAEKARISRVDALVATGRLQPSEKDKTLAMAKALAESTVSFAAPDGSSVAPVEQFLRDLESRDTAVLFSKFNEPENKSGRQYSGIDTSKL